MTVFYQEDVVQRAANPNSFGVVLRCWHDAEDLPPQALTDPMMRPLQRGEVGVTFFPSGERSILPESDLILVDRSFQPGDFCKRSIDDVRSGVITNIEVKGRLEHVINGISVEGWRSMDELQNPMDADIGDYVVFNDWLGQVIELFDEAIVEVSTGQLVRLPELSSRLTVGDKGTDILPSGVSVGPGLFGFLMGTNRTGVDTVVAIKHTVLAVCWLALNQSLDPVEAESRRRPQRFWYGQDLSKLTMVRGKSDLDMRVGDKLLFKDPIGLPSTRHGQDGGPLGSQGIIDVQTFVVKETRTTVRVLWQDGIEEMLPATDIIPYMNPDEYDVWPGDHVIWKSEDEKRPAVVQSVNAAERTAIILFSDSGEQELASVLELDAHGSSDQADPTTLSDGLGVRRGDYVFIHRPGTTNGLEKPRVPRIGEIEAWVRESPVVHDGQPTGWKNDMSELGTSIASRRRADGYEEGRIQRVSNEDGPVKWFGEVTGLRLDGTVEVTYSDGTFDVYPLERLTKLYDGLEQLEDLWGDDSDSQSIYDDEGEEMWSMDHDGVWQPHSADDGDEWEDEDDTDDAMDVDGQGWAEVEEMESSVDAPHLPLAEVHDVSPRQKTPIPDLIGRSPPDVPTDVADDVAVDENVGDAEDQDETVWKRFDMLASAPVDHAFYSSPPAQPSKSFLGRLTREYRVLASSLPESILVRAYEDRTDLLRSLIIGPANTPYEDAPFVIDWMLDSNFPNSPPNAHFLSWTNGNGRVNPNLYEEGKVCLSILGTWAGDKNEIWSAARSSLLQAFVSIQGLVLVKEPWFCEPAYEKLRGTEEGIVNSRLYNEKAYVLSRGFVRRALEIPPGGLESEITWLYFTKGRLQKVIHDARALIDKSKASTQESAAEEDKEIAVPRLTAGGIITLERTLAKLQPLLLAGPQKQT